MLLKLRNINKKYKMSKKNEFTALRELDLDFEEGELVSIVGESGSGKSTLMNIIGGLDLDYDGDIVVSGEKLAGLSEGDLDNYRKDKVGFIFQSFNLIPHLNVIDNVTMGMDLSGEDRSASKSKAIEILRRVGLEDHMYKKPNQLSGGQKQRVAIARALVSDPEIILADEPTGALDSETTEQILDIIKEISAEGKLVIMVTHSDLVSAISDRIITLRDGRVIGDEKLKEKPIEKEKEYKEDRDTSYGKLSFVNSIRLAFKNMKEKKARNTLVSLGASIGIASVVLMLSIGAGVGDYMTDTVNSLLNPLVVEVTKESSENDSTEGLPPGGSIMMGKDEPFSDEDIEELQAIDGVEDIESGYSIIDFQNNSLEFRDEEFGVVNIETVSFNMTDGNLESGDFPDKGEILIDNITAEKIGEGAIGSEIVLNTVIDGVEISDTYLVSGVYASSSFGEMNSVYINYDDLLESAENSGQTFEPSVVYLLAESEERTESINEEVEKLGYAGSKEEQMLGAMTEMIDIVTYLLTAISGIALVVSAIMILVVMYISVVERTKEIGTLKALGASRGDIKKIFSAEACLIGVFSGIIGLVSSQLMGIIINAATSSALGISVVGVYLNYMIFGFIVSVLVSLIAGLSPASKAAKLDPVEALRSE